MVIKRKLDGIKGRYILLLTMHILHLFKSKMSTPLPQFNLVGQWLVLGSSTYGAGLLWFYLWPWAWVKVRAAAAIYLFAAHTPPLPTVKHRLWLILISFQALHTGYIPSAQAIDSSVAPALGHCCMAGQGWSFHMLCAQERVELEPCLTVSRGWGQRLWEVGGGAEASGRRGQNRFINFLHIELNY